MESKITNPTNATINFMYFLTNTPNGFIEKCWKDKPSLINHLEGKFRNYCEKHGTHGINTFFYELDMENQKILIEWVNENYKSFSTLVDNYEKF